MRITCTDFQIVIQLLLLSLVAGCVSEEVTVTAVGDDAPVTDTTAPAVQIISPTNQASVSENFTVEASATDTSGIASVEFHANGSLVKTDTTQPYSASISAVAGSNEIRVVAVDNSAMQNSAEASVTVVWDGNDPTPPDDTIAPSVTITSPADQADVSENFTVEASATDASGIASVEFHANGSLVKTDTTQPYSASISAVAGSNEIRVVAVDNSPNQNSAETSVTVMWDGVGTTPPGDTIAPTVTISNPTNGADVSGATQIAVTASDASGIESVEIFVNDVSIVVDTSEPFEATWTPTADGTYVIRAVAIDGSAAANTAQASVTVQTPGSSGGSLRIADLGLHEVDHGSTISIMPQITGTADICRKDMGHDDLQVDSETGEITWNTSALLHGRGFYVRIKCSNATESAFSSGVIHVDKSGSSTLRIAGQNGVSPYIGVAARAMSSGDTVVFPDGLYPVSVSRDESYENGFSGNSPTAGSFDQLSTIMSRNPGGAVIDGAPHDGIPKAKKAFEFSNVNYVAVAGFVVRNVRRESFKAVGGSYLLVEFLGTAGAGTNLLTCDSFSAAGDGWCSNAGFKITSISDSLVQNGYNWADNRYGLMLRSTDRSVVRRSLVRLDAYRGDQPYGAHSHYCTKNDVLQDSMAIDSLAIAAPHYKNYAGIAAYPATGCEGTPVGLETVGFISLNNDLHLSLADSKAAGTHSWRHIVNWDTESTCTPQGNRCSRGVLQSDQSATWERSTTGVAKGFNGGSVGGYFTGNVTSTDSSFQDLTSGSLGLSLDSSNNTHTVNGHSDENNLFDSLRYLPKAERGSALENKTADLLYHYGKSDTFHGEAEFNQLTSSRRWPIAGEDIIAKQMRSYNNPDALAVGGGTVSISGDRGATQTGESISEYIWGYIDDRIPPLVVRVKDKGSSNRVAWEPLSSDRAVDVTGWIVLCMDGGTETQLASVGSSVLVHTDATGCSEYAVQARYAGGDSGISYIESAE